MNAINKPKVLITGANGRIGKRVIERLADSYFVIPTDNESSDSVDIENYVMMDLTKEEYIKTSLQKIKELYGDELDSVIHLAAYYSFSNQDWQKYQQITIKGTERLLKSLKKNFKVGQFIFSSTILVYQPLEPGKKINEDSPLRAEWEYPKSKVITENILFENHGDIPLVIFRIAGCYDEECNSIPLSHQIKRIYTRSLRMNLFSGNITHGSAYLHFDDLIEAIYNAIERRKELPKEVVINLAEPITYSYDQLQRRISKLLLNKEFKTYQIPKFLAKFGSWLENGIPFLPKPFIKPWMVDICDDHYELDISLAKSLIQWEPKNDIYETMPKIIEGLKKYPKKWFKRHHIKIN